MLEFEFLSLVLTRLRKCKVIRQNQRFAARVIIPRVTTVLSAVCPPERLTVLRHKCGLLVFQLVVLIVATVIENF